MAEWHWREMVQPSSLLLRKGCGVCSTQLSWTHRWKASHRDGYTALDLWKLFCSARAVHQDSSDFLHDETRWDAHNAHPAIMLPACLLAAYRCVYKVNEGAGSRPCAPMTTKVMYIIHIAGCIMMAEIPSNERARFLHIHNRAHSLQHTLYTIQNSAPLIEAIYCWGATAASHLHIQR